MDPKRYFIARVFADYDAAVQTVEMVREYGDLQRAERERRAFRTALSDNTLLIVTAGHTWGDAEQDLKARLGT